MNVLTCKNLVHMSRAPTDDDKAHHVFIILGNPVGTVPELLLVPSEQFRGEYHSKDGDHYVVKALHFGYLIEIPYRDTLDIYEWITHEMENIQPVYEGNRDVIVASDVDFVWPRIDAGSDVILISLTHPHARMFEDVNGKFFPLMYGEHGFLEIKLYKEHYKTPYAFIEKNFPTHVNVEDADISLDMDVYAKDPDISLDILKLN